jgi:GNAT superfamily N-acetyltransferase
MPNDDPKLDPDITVTDVLDPADVAVITDGLRAYDLNQIGYHDFRPLTVFVRDPQTGKVVGGLYGRSEFGLVYVAWFFLPEDWRRARIGSRVLAMAEEEGRRRGCTRIALTTLSIEAPGFYQKQGYDVAATID